ncbi:MAG: DUF2520 domain-containing protein [Paludibacteraceae bacterium]|nr:DUF2520 domain-containing protein [Paludibacteraceae bacterium]
MKILIIGKGNVACNLLQAFRQKDIDTQMVSSREGLDTIAADRDVYIYAVQDKALKAVIDQVHVSPRALHLHTSGTMPLEVFGEDKKHCGIIYPFQTFSKARLIDDFSTVPVFIEARQIDDVSATYTVALTLTPHVFEASQHDRERLHMAGVFVNNFPNALYGIAAKILKETNIPFSALLPIIDQTALKVHTLTPEQAQTGPAKRNDTEVMTHHLSLLKNDKLKQLYQLLSDLIQESN